MNEPITKDNLRVFKDSLHILILLLLLLLLLLYLLSFLIKTQS